MIVIDCHFDKPFVPSIPSLFPFSDDLEEVQHAQQEDGDEHQQLSHVGPHQFHGSRELRKLTTSSK